jgi:imidazolonepropionase-like amidohydrolase
MMAERKVFWVPTLSVTVPPVADSKGMPEFYLRKKREAEEYALKTFEMALQAGVRIASGSDAGGPGAYHGNNAFELELMVKAGMSHMDAIVSATKIASECCGVERVTGTIEPGKSADIVAVKGDPLSDISVLRRVSFVMKEGNVVKQSMD